jgi:hypothetical protein
VEFETDGRFLGLRIRLDLVNTLDLSGDPDDPSVKNPQYSFHWLNEWKDMIDAAGSDMSIDQEEVRRHIKWASKAQHED